MWAILFAVFGGAYLLCKICSEGSASKEAKRRSEDWSRAFDEWRANIEDRRLEDEIELYIYNNRADAMQEAKRICPVIPEDQYNETTYLRILLSEHGKIQWQDGAFGITTPLYGHYPALIAKQKYRDFFEFVVWLNGNLERHGAKTGQLLFTKSYPGPNSKEYYSLYEARDLSATGTYWWDTQLINAYLGKG